MPSDGPGERNVVAAIVVVALVTLVYSVVIAQQILAWFGIAIPLVLLYLIWRFVRAHERIADALEE
jgi:threonine/homoserine/homoserine lactone efflux protein